MKDRLLEWFGDTGIWILLLLVGAAIVSSVPDKPITVKCGTCRQAFTVVE